MKVASSRLAPVPTYSSGYTCRLLEEGAAKARLFLQAGLTDPAARQVQRMTQIAGYLRANFPPAALARGPVQ